MNKREESEVAKRVDDMYSSARKIVADTYRLTVGDTSEQASDLLKDADELQECAWTLNMRIVDYLKVRSHRG